MKTRLERNKQQPDQTRAFHGFEPMKNRLTLSLLRIQVQRRFLVISSVPQSWIFEALIFFGLNPRHRPLRSDTIQVLFAFWVLSIVLSCCQRGAMKELPSARVFCFCVNQSYPRGSNKNHMRAAYEIRLAA